MGVKIEVGKEYIVTDIDGDVSKILVVKLFKDGAVNVKYLKSTFYTPGNYGFIGKHELENWKIEPAIKTTPNPALIDLYIDLALATKDKEWFEQLTKEREAIH